MNSTPDNNLGILEHFLKKIKMIQKQGGVIFHILADFEFARCEIVKNYIYF